MPPHVSTVCSVPWSDEIEDIKSIIPGVAASSSIANEIRDANKYGINK